MLRFIKTYGSFAIGLLISFLSVLSTDKAPMCVEGKELTYLFQLFSYKLFVYKEFIGWIAIGCLIVGTIIVWISYRPQKRFMEEICSYVRRNIDLAPENEIQVSIFLIQSGWRTLLTYLRNLIMVCFNRKYWKNGLFRIYLVEKFPNVRKDYYVRKEQSKAKQSFKKPTIYFQMTYAEEEQNGYLSFYMADLRSKYINIDPFNEYKYTRKKEDYKDAQGVKLKNYLSSMKLSFEDLRCTSSAANFIHIEPLVDRNNHYKGALVIDITHSTKIKTSDNYKTFIEKVAKIVNLAENNIE